MDSLSTLSITDHCATSPTALPEWDGSSIKAALFLRDIQEWLERKGMVDLPLKGFFASRNVLIIVSADHLAHVKAFFMGNAILPNDFQDPPDPPVAATLDCTYNLTVDDKKQYVASPQLFLAESAKLNAQALQRITNTTVQRRKTHIRHRTSRT